MNGYDTSFQSIAELRAGCHMKFYRPEAPAAGSFLQMHGNRKTALSLRHDGSIHKGNLSFQYL
jgi:hypothetical protein